MTGSDIALVILTTVGFLAPVAAASFASRTDPRLSAGVAVLALADLALLPAVWLSCLASGLPAPGAALATGCWPVIGSVTGRRVEAGLAVVLLVTFAVCAVASLRRSAAARPRGLARVACCRHPLPTAGSALVVPTDEPLAYVAGVVKPEVVVSSGLLRRLSAEEQRAVLAHEVAHLRFGHVPLLTLGWALARTYRWLPGMTRAWTVLRRELEAAADDEAARAAGTAPLLSALARVSLARSSAPAFNDLDAATLRYRIDRLRHPGRTVPTGRSPATLCGLTLAAALSWSGCVLAGRPGILGLLACALGVGWLASRPAGGVRGLRQRLAGPASGR